MSELEREALLVLAPLRRALRGDNRRFASWRLRLSKGPIVDWLLERGFVEMRLVSMVEGWAAHGHERKEEALVVTEAGEAFWSQRKRRSA